MLVTIAQLLLAVLLGTGIWLALIELEEWVSGEVPEGEEERTDVSRML